MAIPSLTMTTTTVVYADDEIFARNFLTSTLGEPIGMYGFEGDYALKSHDEIVEIVVQFKTPPAVALRLMADRNMPQVRGFGADSYEERALIAHENFGEQLKSLNNSGGGIGGFSATTEIFSEHHSLLNGVYMRVPARMVETISTLPEVFAVVPNYKIYPLYADSFADDFAVSQAAFYENAQFMRTTRQFLGIDYIHNEMGITGNGVRVAVVDSGIEHSHREFLRFHCPVLGRIRGGTPTQSNAASFNPSHNENSRTHGTLVSGAVIGIAPNVELWNYRINLAGAPANDTSLRGIEAAHRDGAQVINLSFGSSNNGPFDSNARAVTLASLDGVVVVVSAGNDGRAFGGGSNLYSISSPGTSPLCITVGSGDFFNGIRDYSSHGPVTGTYHIKPDIIGGPTPVFTTTEFSGYREASGTSFSSPIVAGIAALLLEKFPDAQPWEIKARLMNTAQKIPNAPESVFSVGAGFVAPRIALTQEAFATVRHSVPVSDYAHAGAYANHLMSSLSFGEIFENETAEIPITIHNAGAGTWSPQIIFNGNNHGANLILNSSDGKNFSAKIIFSDETPFGFYEGNIIFTNGDAKISMPFAANFREPLQMTRYIDARGSVRQQLAQRYNGETNLYSGWYFVSGTQTPPAFVTIRGNVNIILEDGSHFNAINGGLSDPFLRSNINIYAQSTGDEMGRMTTYETYFNSGFRCNSLTINGGNINSQGAISGAEFNYFTMNGGKLNASCLGTIPHMPDGTGLGGLFNPRVTIYGGHVIATGLRGGAGIGYSPSLQGGGTAVSHMSINIYGGTVEATAGGEGISAAIGLTDNLNVGVTTSFSINFHGRYDYVTNTHQDNDNHEESREFGRTTFGPFMHAINNRNIPSLKYIYLSHFDVGANGLIVPSDDERVFINLTNETITIPFFGAVTVNSYSLNGGRTWKKGNPFWNQRKFPRFLKKDLHLWLSDTWNPKNKTVNGVTIKKGGETPDAKIIKFEPINKRPKRKIILRPFYSADDDGVWQLENRAAKDGVSVFEGFEFVPTANGKTPDNEWNPLSHDGFEILPFGRTKQRYLVRKAPYFSDGKYFPAEKIFRVTPANFRAAPTRKLAKNGSLTLKKGDAYSFFSADEDFTTVSEKTTLSPQYLADGGSVIFIKIAATGKRPASTVQTLPLTTAFSNAPPTVDEIIFEEENFDDDEKIIFEEENFDDDEIIFGEENFDDDEKIIFEEKNSDDDEKIIFDEENFDDDEKIIFEEENFDNDEKIIFEEEENILDEKNNLDEGEISDDNEIIPDEE